jgi:murein DD-endopeptidase MepM/ murein hydrolase activator NlpD
MTSRVGIEFDGRANGAATAGRQAREAIRGVRQEAGAASHPVRQLDNDLGKLTRGAVAGSGVFRGFGRSIAFASSGFLGAYGLSAAVRGAASELTNSIKVTARVNQVVAATGGVAGVTAKHIDALANAQLRKTGIDDEAVKSAAAVLLTFRNVRDVTGQGNDVFDQAIRLSQDLAEVMGTDLESAALQVGKALQDPVTGLTALRRAGVAFDAEQRKEIQTLVSHGKLLEAQKIILQELQREVGGTAAKVGNVAPWMRLRETIRNLSASAIQPLLPEMDGLVGRAQKWADELQHDRDAQRKLRDEVSQAVDVVKKFVHGADDVAGALGGWKRAIQELIALRLMVTVAGWTQATAAFIGAAGTGSAAGVGVLGAAAATREATASAVAWKREAGGAFVAIGSGAATAIGSAAGLTGLLGAEAAAAGLLGKLRALVASPWKIVAVTAGLQQPDKVTGSAGFKVATSAADEIVGDKFRIGSVWYVWDGKKAVKTTPPDAGTSGAAETTLPPTSAKGVQLPSFIVPTHQTAGLTGFPAVDIMAKPGTPIRAPEDGVITRISGHEPTEPPPQGQGGPWGLSIYFLGTKSGNTYYMTHLVKVAEPGAYKLGDVIGIIGDYPGSSADHVHFAIHPGDSPEAHVASGLFNPADYLAKPGRRTGAAPPHSGSGSGSGSSNVLPARIRQAISAAGVAAASAALTPKKADDKAAVAQQKAALEAEIAWLNAKLATKLGPEKRITLEDLLTGALGDLKSLSPSKTAGAGVSPIISLRNQASQLLKTVPANADAVERAAQSHLEKLRAALRVGMSSKELAQTRIGIQNWGKILKDEIAKQAKAAADAADRAAELWGRTWNSDADKVLRDFRENVADKQLQAFDDATNAHLTELRTALKQQLDTFDAETKKGLDQLAAPEQTPEERALAEFQATRKANDELQRKQDILAQIAALQAQLAGTTAGANGTLIDIATGQRSPLTGDAVSNAEDIQKQILDLQQQYHQLELDDQEQALQAAADASRKAADKAATTAQDAYQADRDAQRQALEDKESDAEDAYQRDRAALRQHLQDMLDDQATALQQDLEDWGTWLEAKKKSWADFLQWMRDHGFDTSNVTNPAGGGTGSSAADGGIVMPGGRATIGGAIAFATGGKVPGRFVGREDTVLARLTPGEHVTDRQLTAAMEDFFLGGRDTNVRVIAGDVYLDGFKVGQHLARPVTDQQARQIGYRSQIG